jgi:hypothetical protein
MFLNTNVGVAGLSLKWVQGSNGNLTCNIVGSTCTLDGLDGFPGITTIYNDTVRITNAGSGQATFDITTTQCQGSTNNLTSIYVKIYSSTNSLLYTLNVWQNHAIGSALTDLPIGAGVTWKLGWEITWYNNATVSDNVNVALRLDVSS